MKLAIATLAALVLAACSGTSPGTGSSTTGGPTGTSHGSGASSGSAASTGGAGSSTSGGGPTSGAASSGGGSSSGGTSSGGGTSAGGSTGGSSTGGCPGGSPPASCTPGQSPDPCSPYGYVCTLQSDFSGRCQLPTELLSCLPCVGCDSSEPALQCTAVGASHACVRTCSSTADCPDTLSSCQPSGGQSYCLYDLCGPATGNGGSYYGSCNAIGNNGDGTCLPVTASSGTAGVCLQNGAASGGSCSTVRGAGGDVSQVCPSGQVCFPTQVGSTQGVCEPLCAATGPAGPGCGSSQFCWDPAPASLDWGLCVDQCTGNPLLSTCQTGYCVSLGGQQGCLP